jgi:hypothetical protein
VDPVPDPLLRKIEPGTSGSVARPLDHRGGLQRSSSSRSIPMFSTSAYLMVKFYDSKHFVYEWNNIKEHVLKDRMLGGGGGGGKIVHHLNYITYAF